MINEDKARELAHVDWRTDGNGKTMIEIGLALEAPERMYNN